MNKYKDIITGARDRKKADMRGLLNRIFTIFIEFHGDRINEDDPAIISGIGRIGKYAVTAISTNKGVSLNESINTHFGCPTPAGYRKALRTMEIGESLRMPILTFINTPGAFSGEEAETNGQGQTIAKCLSKMLQIKVPIITFIVGEAGSGGALALSCSDRVIMFEKSMYTILSPEGFSSILWKSPKFSDRAAELMKIDPNFLKEKHIIDTIIPEDYFNNTKKLTKKIIDELSQFDNVNLTKLLNNREQRFRNF